MSATQLQSIQTLEGLLETGVPQILLQKPWICYQQAEFQLGPVFCEAWLSAITPANVISGFRNIGVYPFNHHAISCVSASSQVRKDLPTQGIFNTTSM